MEDILNTAETIQFLPERGSIEPDPIKELENGLGLWAAVLEKIPNGVIAGGAIRDFIMGVQPKDIDVFIPSKLFKASNFEQWEPHPNAVEYEAGDHVDAVLQRKLFGWVVDLILVNLPETEESFGARVIKSFDFGITRSWFDGELHDTLEACHDREKGRVTLMLEDRLDRAWKRFDRFNAAHGNSWTFVAPPRPTEEVI